MSKKKLTFAQKTCVAATGKLMQQTRMVHHGARVGVAVSGGVDSFVLMKVLAIRQRIIPFPVELMALHVNPGFEPESHTPLTKWCADNSIPLHAELTDYGPRAHSEENRKNSPCFLCAWNRRKRLFELCDQYSLTHLAMGHNTDDLAATFFMNMVNNGRVDGLAAKEAFFGGALTMIRPALLVDKSSIRTAARQWNLPIWENVCPSNGATARTDMEQIVSLFPGPAKTTKTNIFNALRRHQIDLTLRDL